ncbi:MAG: hypothetical protein J6T74_06070 [Clostridia bacterium]|nr:hypothetical protein [Clostridia bacterium]
MLDERCMALLNYVVCECNEGSFRVFEVGELIGAIPKKYKPDQTSVKICMDYLNKCGYLIIKYKDTEKYCVMPNSNAYEIIENSSQKRKNDKKLIKFGILGYFLVFFFAFLGSFLAKIIMP